MRLDLDQAYFLGQGARLLYAGDDHTLEFILKTSTGYVDLTNAKVWFTIKERSSDPDTEAKLQLSSAQATEVEINADPTTGKFKVKFTDTQTEDLEGVWLYDIQVKDSNNAIRTYASGKITFLTNLTRSNS